MAKRHLKKFSTSFREVQIKTTLRFHLTEVKMAKIKKSEDNLYCRGYGVKGPFLHYFWKFRLIQHLYISLC